VPHRLSLVRRLADLRRLYTGETDSSVHPQMAYAGKLLDADERLLLVRALDRNYTGRLLGDDTTAPLPPDVRAAVLPDAGSSRQRELEADVLLAASRAANYLHPLPELAKQLNLRPGRMVRMVRSQPDDLILHLERAVLGPLLLELLPRITAEGTLAGVPGLRALLYRRHVVLYSFDTAAQVTLANVSYRQWAAALAFAEAAHVGPESDPLRWLGNDPTPLAEPELAAILDRPRAGGLVRLASSVLRRVGLFGAAKELRVYEAQPDTLYVQWHGGPTAARVATLLVHPVTGLPGNKFFVVPQAEYVTVHSLDDGLSVVLQQLQGDDTPVAPPTPEVVAMWKAWDERMWQPNPCWPTDVLSPQTKDGDAALDVPVS
jgi:hypothetical protein